MRTTVREYIELLKHMPLDATVVVNFHSDYHLVNPEHWPREILGRVHLGNDDIITARPEKIEYDKRSFDPVRVAELEAHDEQNIASWDADTEHKGPTETFVVIGH